METTAISRLDLANLSPKLKRHGEILLFMLVVPGACGALIGLFVYSVGSLEFVRLMADLGAGILIGELGAGFLAGAFIWACGSVAAGALTESKSVRLWPLTPMTTSRYIANNARQRWPIIVGAYVVFPASALVTCLLLRDPESGMIYEFAAPVLYLFLLFATCLLAPLYEQTTRRRLATGFLFVWRQPFEWVFRCFGLASTYVLAFVVFFAAFGADRFFLVRRLLASALVTVDNAPVRIVAFMASPFSPLTYSKVSPHGPALLWPYVAVLAAVVVWMARSLILHLRKDTAPSWHEDPFARHMEIASRRKFCVKNRFNLAEWLGSASDSVAYRQDLAYDAALDPESQIQRHARQWLRPRSERLLTRLVERATPETLFLSVGFVWPLGIPVLAWFAHDYHVGLWIAIGALMTALAPAAFLGERTLMATPLPLRWRVVLTREYARQLQWQGVADVAAALMVAVIGGSVLMGLWVFLLIQAVRVTGLLSAIVEAAHAAGRSWPAWVNRVTFGVTLAATTVPHFVASSTVSAVTGVDAEGLRGLLGVFSVWAIQFVVTTALAFAAIRYTGPAVPGFVDKRGFLRAEMTEADSGG